MFLRTIGSEGPVRLSRRGSTRPWRSAVSILTISWSPPTRRSWRSWSMHLLPPQPSWTCRSGGWLGTYGFCDAYYFTAGPPAFRPYLRVRCLLDDASSGHEPGRRRQRPQRKHRCSAAFTPNRWSRPPNGCLQEAMRARNRIPSPKNRANWTGLNRPFRSASQFLGFRDSDDREKTVMPLQPRKKLAPVHG